MAEVERLVVKVGAETAEFKKGMQTAGAELDKFEGRATKTGGKIGAAFATMARFAGPVGTALAAVGGATWGVATAGDNAANNMRRLEAIIRTTGGAAGVSGKQIKEFSAQLARDTMASSDEVERSAAKLLTYNRVTQAEFWRTLELSQDLAEIGFGSLEENANRLGKALQDPITGVGALAEVGVSFTAVQREQIRNFTEANKLADAQRLVLQALADQVGGAGASQGGIAAGMDSLGEATKTFLETIEGKLGVAQWFGDRLADIAGSMDKISSILNPSLADAVTEAYQEQAAAQLEVFKVMQKIEQAKQSGMSQETIDRETATVLHNAQAKLKVAEATHEAAKAKLAEAQAAEAAEQAERNRISNLKQQQISAELAAAKQEELQKLAEEKIKGLEKEKELLTAVTGLDRLRIELKYSELEALDEVSKARLLALQAEIDAGQKAADAARNQSREIQGPETEGEHYEKAKAGIDDFFRYQELSETEREKANKEHEDRIAAFRQLSWDKQAETVTGGLSSMSSAMASHSKKMFELNKIAGIANAIVSTARGVTKALELPFPLNLAAAATTAAAGFAQIQAIRSQTFNGGGSNPPAPGGGGVPTSAPVAEQEPARRYINVQGIDAGSLFDSKSVRELIRQIGQELGDGVVLSV